MTTLALFSNKGGVGKTATAVNLAYLAAKGGKSTLICDLDPQASTTFYFRVKPRLKRQARGLVKGGKSVDRSIKGTDYENLDLLPADFSHRNLDITFNTLKRSKRRLDIVLAPLKEEYNLIILDCPPTINLVAENIINTADFLLEPLIPTTLSVRAHEQLLAFLEESGRGSKKVSTFFSMVDGRRNLHQEIMTTLRAQFDNILETTIPYLSKIEQMGITREPVPAFAPDSRTTRAYVALWAEIQRKIFNS
jgi:cellulose biosynthesis protein BcsQ